MNKAIQHISTSKNIILGAMQTMGEDIDPADRHLYNMAPEGFVPVTNSDIVQSNLEDKYATDIAEMQDLAVKAYVGNMTAAESARLNELLELYDGEVGGIELLLSGNYAGHFFEQGMGLDLDAAEAAANAFNGNDNHLLIQSIFDPVVADKPLTIDEYSVVVNLPAGMNPNDFLLQMAGDMDGTLGDDFHDAGDFQNQGDSPEVGQVIDIDVKDVPTWWASIPFIDDESPLNAPVIISEITEGHFTVQTLELNGNEHPLHGTRQWGFETLEDGSVRYYTRGISVEDSFLAEQGAQGGEQNMWNIWVDGVENTVTDQGGSVVEETRVSNQSSGPTGNDLWETLPPSQQAVIQSTQITGLEREISHLNEQLTGHPLIDSSTQSRINELNNEIAGWQNK